MNEEVFKSVGPQVSQHFGVTAQREIEKSVDAALSAGKLKGTETLKARARLEIQGLPTDLVIEQDITLRSASMRPPILAAVLPHVRLRVPRPPSRLPRLRALDSAALARSAPRAW